MDTLLNSETALLGLLCEEPMHPYQIEKQVRFQDMRSWTELSMSSIYKLLRKLESAGLVRSKQAIAAGRSRKTYEVSARGRKALEKKVRELLSEPQPVIWPIDIATYNIDQVSINTAIECLRRYRSRIEDGVRCYRELEKYLRQCGCPEHRCSVAVRPQYLLKAELEWLRSLLGFLSRNRRGKQ